MKYSWMYNKKPKQLIIKLTMKIFACVLLSIDSANSPHSIDFDLNYQLTDLSIIMIFQNCMHV